MRKISQTIAVSIALCGLAGLAFAQNASVQSKKLPVTYLKNLTPKTAHSADPSFTAGRVKYLPNGTKITSATSLATTGLPGVDTLANWSDQFTTPGFDFFGNPQSVWPYTMVGTPPESGQNTIFRAPIVPVVVDLLGPERQSCRFRWPPAYLLSHAPNHKVDRRFPGLPAVYLHFRCRAVQRPNHAAQFWNRFNGNNWHNLLAPLVRRERHMQIPFGFWFFFTDANNNPVAAALDANTFSSLFFPADSPGG